jgi:hypothetical protein
MFIRLFRHAPCVTTALTAFKFCMTLVVSWGVLSALEGYGVGSSAVDSIMLV